MITAVTIDFWNTIVDTSNGDARWRIRNAALAEAFERAGKPFDGDAVRGGFARVYEEFEREWFGRRRTMTAGESLRVLWSHLGITVSDDTHARIARAFEDSIINGMPNLLPGAGEALRLLADRYALAVISDTAFSPGRALRRVLDHHGVLGYLTALVFSDETGVSKPHPLAFRTALDAVGASPDSAVHIGDIERTDIAGAKDAGMRAILFIGDVRHSYNTGTATRADAVADSWDAVPSILGAFDAAAA